ncbi:MAG TPA: hypothetical protein VJ650_04750 [Gemmatimonadaceae bacterium]|nr:hypothetical protein [Gemmatimonadaceae bacterium]
MTVLYSPPLVTAASHVIRMALGSDSRADDQAVRETLRALCSDARRLGVRPEELVVLVKMTWRAHPDLWPVPPDHASSTLDRVVTMCIEEYFRNGATS